MSNSFVTITVPSTNTYAMRTDLPHNTVVVSPMQSGGKGRDGRCFVSAAGGAYFSVVRREDMPVAQCARYMLAAPLAVADVLATYGVQAQVKWPNDVLVHGAKIAGILVETVWQGATVQKAVVGIGINVNNPLDGVDCRAVNLCALVGRSVDVMAVVQAVCVQLDIYLAMSVSALVDALRPLLYTLGKTVRTPSGAVGVAQAINEDGSLVVATAAGPVVITAGDVIIMEEIC